MPTLADRVMMANAGKELTPIMRNTIERNKLEAVYNVLREMGVKCEFDFARRKLEVSWSQGHPALILFNVDGKKNKGYYVVSRGKRRTTIHGKPKKVAQFIHQGMPYNFDYTIQDKG